MLGARVQPQGGQVRLSALVRSLGFTYAFNFGSGSPITPNLITGNQALSLIQGALSAGGPGGRAFQLNGVLGSRIEVSGNPFSTSSCTYLWIDSGVDATSNGQCVVQTRYDQSAMGEQYGLQIRIIGNEIRILSAQAANRVTAVGRDNSGGLNASAVSIVSPDGRHAVFNRGQLLYGAAPPALAQQYIHGTNAIGGAFDCTSSSVKYYTLLFAPRAVSDEALRYLTANPWAMFEDTVDDELFVSAAATPTSASLVWTEGNETSLIVGTVSDPATIAWTEGGESASISGMVKNRSDLAWTEQGDLYALTVAAASPPMAGTASLAWTESGDGASVIAKLTNLAVLAVSEQSDAWQIVVNSTLPPATPAPNIYTATIMRATSTNRIADIGPASINITTGFP